MEGEHKNCFRIIDKKTPAPFLAGQVTGG